MREQFGNLARFSRERGLSLTRSDLPNRTFGKGGLEHEIFHDDGDRRIWKSTFPDQAGYGPAGFSTPVGYLRRLRLSNRVFGDDVRFEGIWKRDEGLSIVISQRYIHPDFAVGMPSMKEIAAFMKRLGFVPSDAHSGWIREADEVLVQDAHRGNFIEAIDGEMYAIDVQPRLPRGKKIDDAIPYAEAIDRTAEPR